MAEDHHHSGSENSSGSNTDDADSGAEISLSGSGISSDPDVAKQSPLQQHTPKMIEHLVKTRPWLMFFAVLLFIGAGFMLLGSLVMIVASSLADNLGGQDTPFPVGLMGLIYVPFVAFYIYLGVLFIRMVHGITDAEISNSTAKVEVALDRMRHFWKVMGIITIVSIALALLLIPLSVVIPLLLAS